MFTIRKPLLYALGPGSVATCPQRKQAELPAHGRAEVDATPNYSPNSSDLTTINKKSFQTKDINGENTTFTFQTNEHKNTVKGLSFTSYFRYREKPGQEYKLGLKYHFTVTLSITNTPTEKETPPVIHITYNNPHLTVRTDVNASQQANKPGLHISCDRQGEWTGNDDQIDKSQLPPQEAAIEMWELFKENLMAFFIESTLEEDPYLTP
jgi:hypothetical protein